MKEIVCMIHFVILLTYEHYSIIERKVRLNTLRFGWMVSWSVSIHLFARICYLMYLFLGRLLLYRETHRISDFWTCGKLVFLLSPTEQADCLNIICFLLLCFGLFWFSSRHSLQAIRTSEQMTEADTNKKYSFPSAR